MKRVAPNLGLVLLSADVGKTIHPHPTVSESIGMAAQAFEGVCTELPPQQRKR